MYNGLALITAATFIFFPAGITLYKKEMTAIIPAIRMQVCRLPALMTCCDNVFRDPFSQAFIKNKVLPDEFAFKPLLFYLAGIVDDPPFEVEHVLKPMMKHKGRSFFTTYATGTIHDYAFFFLILHHLYRHR
jgi:hypothetical protein